MSITKSVPHKIIFANEKKIKKIWIIFDIENWLWKSQFCHFWQLLLNWSQVLIINYGPIGRPGRMCDSVRWRWGHTEVPVLCFAKPDETILGTLWAEQHANYSYFLKGDKSVSRLARHRFSQKTNELWFLAMKSKKEK